MAGSAWGRLANGGLAVAVAVAGVTVGGAAANASGARKTAVYRVTKSGYVHGPAHLAPGRVKIRLRGTKTEVFQLVRSRHGAGKAALIADSGKVDAMGDPNPLEHDFVLAGGAMVKHSLYVTLGRGTYYAVDTNDHSPSAAKIQKISVSGKKKNAAKPKTHSITAVKSEDWSKKPKSIPHEGVLKFSNKASQSHFIVMQRLKPGKTRKDIGLVLQGKETEKEALYTGARNQFQTGVRSPHGSMSVTYKLPKGNYALLCFWPDRKTHMPHALMGMYRVIKLK